MHVFYTPEICSDAYTFDEAERRHGVQVLRLVPGDQIILVDGKGGHYEATITVATKKELSVHIDKIEQSYRKRKFRLHIAIAPTKNIERLEWFLEKATETGIDEITSLNCDRSERKIVKDERLSKVITAAMKQSMQAYHPILHPIKTFKEFVTSATGLKFIAHCEPGEKKYLNKILPAGEECVILIGPEGDFTPKEIDLAVAHGFIPITLGENRLRTETAAIVSCFEVNLINR